MTASEADALASRFFEASESRRRAAEILVGSPRFRTGKAALFTLLATLLLGVVVGVLTYADLNTYHPEVGRMFLYVMASLGAITGTGALGRSIVNTRRLDAAIVLIQSDGGRNSKIFE